MSSDVKTLNGSNSFTLPKFVISIPCVNGSTTSLVLTNGTVFEIQNLKSPVVLLPSKLYNQLDHLRRNYSTKESEISPGIIVPHSQENFPKQTTSENQGDISTVQNEVLARQQNVREEVEKHLQSHTQIITSYQGKKNDDTFNVLISDDESCYEVLDNRPNPDGILAVKETDSDFAILKKLSERIMTEELAPVPETKNSVKKPKKPTASASFPTANSSTNTTPKNPYLTKATVEALEKEKDREFQCKVCNKKLASIHSYEMHLKIHTDVKDYLCKTCNKAFRWKASYEAHMYVHRKGKPFKCYQCENSYTYKAGLDQHIANKHSNNRKIYRCEQCERHFMSLSGFKLHQETKHQKVPTSYMCEQCGKSMCSRNSLRNHMITHTGTKPYQCKDCNEWFRTPHTMKRHRLKIHLGKCEKKFQCGTCGKLYYTSSQLKTHEIMHTDARPYKCKDCDRTFRSWTHLRGHRNIHLGIKPNKCAYCPKTFTFYANMLKHVKRHGNDKPHKCDLCPKRFFERQELRKHMVSHQKPPGRDKIDIVVEEPEPEPHHHQQQQQQQQPVILDLAGNYSGGYATYQMI